MGRSVSSLRFDAGHAGSTCGACGEDFEQPLLAMVFSDSLVEEYYACPKCLSKVAGLGRQKDVKVDEDEVEEPVAAEVAGAMGEAVGCPHHLGYLKRRPKNTPIPEECLTCSKMIECMY